MSKPLPTSGFRFMTDDAINIWRRTSCKLYVDQEYPEKLHDLHNDYSLAPESITLTNFDVAKTHTTGLNCYLPIQVHKHIKYEQKIFT